MAFMDISGGLVPTQEEEINNREDKSKKVAKKKTEEQKLVTIMKEDGTEVYSCEECKNECKTANGMKNHMIKKHRLRSAEEDDDDDAKKARRDGAKDASFDEKILENYDQGEGEEDSQSQTTSLDDMLSKYDNAGKAKEMNQNAITENGKVAEAATKEGNTEVKSVELASAIERIQILEEDLNETKAKLESLERAVETKDNLIDLYKGKNDELEIEALNSHTQTKKYERCFKLMTADVKKLQKEASEGGDKEAKGRIKKMTDQIKDKDKKIVETERHLLEMTKRANEEANKRVEAENKMKIMEKNLENLTKIMEMEKEKREAEMRQQQQAGSREQPSQGRWGQGGGQHGQGRNICRDLNKPGGCNWGSACRHIHPPGMGREDQIKITDCTHWMEGNCRFPDERCMYIHEESKKGTKKKTNRQDFAEALAMVKEVRDAVTGGSVNIQQRQGNMNQQQNQLMMNPPQNLMMNQPQMMMQQQPVMPAMNQMMQQPMTGQMMMQPMMVLQQPNQQAQMQQQQQGWPGSGQFTRQ